MSYGSLKSVMQCKKPFYSRSSFPDYVGLKVKVVSTCNLFSLCLPCKLILLLLLLVTLKVLGM